MDIRRYPYAFLTAFIVIVMFLVTEARSEIYNSVCPGVCSPGIVPDCNTLCTGLGFPGSYCKGLTCCCKPKSSKLYTVSPP
ncbi:hypothetical protein EUTSA_v10012357mg [Eutrema salsugineum]|uniref:Knottin scorpion toxin-like domain-containing protein n=1 Tax=Eutrema salsugineum TaxID=72664 RepID=V4KT56_EUTSA|nr:hypothetical protein EUTSA_v10012357mg [Eutrema salsugineum]